MTVLLLVTGVPGQFMLVARDLRRHSEDAVVCRLSDAEASALARSRLIGWRGDAEPPESDAAPSSYLALERSDRGWLKILLALPATADRPGVLRSVPGYDDVLRLIDEDAERRATFLARTGVVDRCAANANPPTGTASPSARIASVRLDLDVAALAADLGLDAAAPNIASLLRDAVIDTLARGALARRADGLAESNDDSAVEAERGSATRHRLSGAAITAALDAALQSAAYSLDGETFNSLEISARLALRDAA